MPSSSPITVACFTLGPFETNCYVVSCAATRACWIVDPGLNPGGAIDHVHRHSLAPQAIVLTHAHCDHIAGVADARRLLRTPALPIWVHEAEAQWLTDPLLNLSALGGMDITAPPADRLLGDGERLTLGETSWGVLHTPGHSPGGITLYCEAAATALVGDALFAGSVGRTDFPGSDPRVLADSIRTRLYTLPPQTIALPGHGPPTTIGRERASNPFVRA